MIVRMVRVRIAGPRRRLDETVRVLQDVAALHVDQPHVPDGVTTDPAVACARRHVERCLTDAEAALARLEPHAGDHAPPSRPSVVGPDAVRHARRIRRRADALTLRKAALEDERCALLRYREFFRAFEALAGHELEWPERQAFYVVLRAGASAALAELTRKLERAVGGEVAVLHHQLSTGEWAVLILASSHAAPRVSTLLSDSRVEELPIPPGIAEGNLLRAMPAIAARLGGLSRAVEALDLELRRLVRAEGAWLRGLQLVLRDDLLRLEARARAFAGDYVFVIEGWLPAPEVAALQRSIGKTLGLDVVLSTMGVEGWTAGSTPVALHNPPLFRPFEVFTRMLPLPKYGTIDPTPFVALFLPAFFGVIVGDVGYGLMLAGLAAVLRWHSERGTTRRSASTVAFACASTTIAFGVVFGEFFGSLGAVIGLRPIFDREEATVPFLALSLALGLVHIVLALVLSAITAWRGGRRRTAAGRGVALAMLVLTALALLAALEVLPEGLLTPLGAALFVAFVLLVSLEGLVAVIELLSTFGHVLSYARIMALGTASLMVAIVANELAGALGSALVGAVFALLFHLVNFAIALLSPTIHALRLHYVEFFGHFFTPGGAEYRPLAHWHPSH